MTSTMRRTRPNQQCFCSMVAVVRYACLLFRGVLPRLSDVFVPAESQGRKNLYLQVEDCSPLALDFSFMTRWFWTAECRPRRTSCRLAFLCPRAPFSASQSWHYAKGICMLFSRFNAQGPASTFILPWATSLSPRNLITRLIFRQAFLYSSNPFAYLVRPPLSQC